MDRKTIAVIYSSDISKMTKTLLEYVKVEDDIKDKNREILLKPNLVIAATPEGGATTHTEIISTIITYLKEKGFNNIKIIESAWVGDSTERGFKVNHYERFGVPLIDVKKDKYRKVTSEGITMEVSERLFHDSYLINLPVLKGHCQTNMTCAMKNLKGLLSDRSKRQFHTLGLMKPIAALNAVIKPNLTIVDSICGDLDFEEGGNPVISNRMLACKDSVLLDSYCASLLGFSLDDVPYIELGEEYGAGSTKLESASIVMLSKPEEATSTHPTGEARVLSQYTEQDRACSACYASLIHALKRLDEEGSLYRLRGKKIAVGQGFRGKHPEIGCGACCMGAHYSVKGCPPTASNILSLLNSL